MAAPSTRTEAAPAAGRSGNRAGRPAGGQNYSNDDVFALLGYVKEVLPICAEEWNDVHKLYSDWCRLNTRMERSVESIKEKFSKLHKSKKKTGDPSCPPDVRLAKQLNKEIADKTHSAEVDADEPPGDADAAYGDGVDDDVDGLLEDELVDDERVEDGETTEQVRRIIRQAQELRQNASAAVGMW